MAALPAVHATLTPARPDLTQRQRDILDAITKAVAAKGYPPTVREISTAVGLKTPSAVAYQLGELERMGYVRREPGCPRALTVIDRTAKAGA